MPGKYLMLLTVWPSCVGFMFQESIFPIDILLDNDSSWRKLHQSNEQHLIIAQFNKIPLPLLSHFYTYNWSLIVFSRDSTYNRVYLKLFAFAVCEILNNKGEYSKTKVAFEFIVIVPLMSVPCAPCTNSIWSSCDGARGRVPGAYLLPLFSALSCADFCNYSIAPSSMQMTKYKYMRKWFAANMRVFPIYFAFIVMMIWSSPNPYAGPTQRLRHADIAYAKPVGK